MEQQNVNISKLAFNILIGALSFFAVMVLNDIRNDIKELKNQFIRHELIMAKQDDLHQIEVRVILLEKQMAIINERKRKRNTN